MAQLNMSIPHELSQEEALRRIRGNILGAMALNEYVEPVRVDWRDNAATVELKALHARIQLNLVVKDRLIKLSGNLPDGAKFFMWKIESTIREQVDSILV